MNFENWLKQNTSETEKSTPFALEAWSAATKFERDACAKLLEMNSDKIRLMAGELTAQEMRTVQAVLTSLARAIRCRPDTP